MGKIKKLNQSLINMIAAGEVVERPASVLKELLENAIDAGATEIKVYIEDAGEKLIKVVDNGSGMDEDDALLAFEQHATSKLTGESDLFNIKTMGFRGEAIASISSVARATNIDTNNGATATRVVHIDKNIKKDNTNLVEKGTVVSVEGLFDNIPARKKFLKSRATEQRNIANMFIETALPFLDIHFELYSDNKLIHRLTKTGDTKNRIFEIWGKNLVDSLTPGNASSESDITGFLSIPERATQKATHQYFFVNNRYVKSATVSAAVKQAYQGFMHRDLKPNFFLFLNIDPSAVDVNVHPRKLEVKFVNDSDIFKKIYSFVRSTLENKEKSSFLSSLPQNSQVDNQSDYRETDSGRMRFKTNNMSNSTGFSKSLPAKDTSSKSQRIDAAMSFTSMLLREEPVEYSNSSTNKSNDDLTTNSLTNNLSVFQIFNTYIVFENDQQEMIFIDQHAAAEKILFEKLIQKGKKATKPLLVPETITFASKADKDMIIEANERLKALGIIIEDFSDKVINIVEIPETISGNDIQSIIFGILDDDNELIAQYQNSNGQTLTLEEYLTIAKIACHGSIRAGQRLSIPEMQGIVNELFNLQNPGNCPHGRPTYWTISKYELEKHFKRNL